jgi:hypothetical protein
VRWKSGQQSCPSHAAAPLQCFCLVVEAPHTAMVRGVRRIGGQRLKIETGQGKNEF